MKALIKRASFSILLIVFAPFAALADLIDAQRALLNGQFSEALGFLPMTSRTPTPLTRP
jgi:hypothetical protein